MKQREPLLDEPAEDEWPTHEALLNWAEWCRVRRRPGRCFSAEGHYRPPAGNVYHPPEPRRALDPLAAERVNGALLALPEKCRRALHWRYHLQAPDRVIAKALALRPTAYQAFIRAARLMLRNVLLFRRSKPIIRADNPAPEVDARRRGVFYPAGALVSV